MAHPPLSIGGDERSASGAARFGMGLMQAPQQATTSAGVGVTDSSAGGPPSPFALLEFGGDIGVGSGSACSTNDHPPPRRRRAEAHLARLDLVWASRKLNGGIGAGTGASFERAPAAVGDNRRIWQQH